jgi:hypothetical protein
MFFVPVSQIILLILQVEFTTAEWHGISVSP